MTPFLVWLEATPLHDWIVGSPSLFAFPGILALHAIGMGFAAGLSAAIDLRLLGVARAVPLGEMRRLLPILWAGFWLNAASGVLLLIGYPTKALTNPVFYLKLALIAVAMVLVSRIGRHLTAAAGPEPSPAAAGVWSSPPAGIASAPVVATVAPPPIGLRVLAVVSLTCWAGAVTAGRLLAYTYRHLTATENISAMLHRGAWW